MNDYKYPDNIKSLTLSKNIRKANYLEFLPLSHLESIQVSDENKKLKSMNGVLFNKKGTKLIYYPRAKEGTTYTIPKDVSNLDGCFEKNINLKEVYFNEELEIVSSFEGSNIEKVTLPNNIKFISECAFQDCKKLKTVVVGKNVSSIGKQAFAGCTSLKKVTLSKKLNKISALAFNDCKSLKKITIPDNVSVIQSSAFEGCNAKIEKAPYLQKQKDNSYRSFASIKDMASGEVKQFTPKKITNITSQYKNISITIGKNKKLDTIAYVSGKENGILDTSLLKFTSSDNKKVKVNKKGKITARKRGKATIKVKYRPYNLSYKVNVTVN